MGVNILDAPNSRTPSNSPLEGEELRPLPFQGGTEGVLEFAGCIKYMNAFFLGKLAQTIANTVNRFNQVVRSISALQLVS